LISKAFLRVGAAAGVPTSVATPVAAIPAEDFAPQPDSSPENTRHNANKRQVEFLIA
jgi:hypothetical protein